MSISKAWSKPMIASTVETKLFTFPKPSGENNIVPTLPWIVVNSSWTAKLCCAPQPALHPYDSNTTLYYNCKTIGLLASLAPAVCSSFCSQCLHEWWSGMCFRNICNVGSPFPMNQTSELPHISIWSTSSKYTLVAYFIWLVLSGLEISLRICLYCRGFSW